MQPCHACTKMEPIQVLIFKVVWPVEETGDHQRCWDKFQRMADFGIYYKSMKAIRKKLFLLFKWYKKVNHRWRTSYICFPEFSVINVGLNPAKNNMSMWKNHICGIVRGLELNFFGDNRLPKDREKKKLWHLVSCTWVES